MYAFNDDLRYAWQQLFDRVFLQLDGNDPEPALVFASDAEVLLDDGLLFGHTCGYPLMTRFQNLLTPFCVPLFDVPGCDGPLYCSHLIVNAEADIESVGDCRGLTVAINTPDSNSGMNLLRHALALAGARGKFFRRVLMTDGHLHSLEAIADGRADLAAIDCVTWQMIRDQDPSLVARTRSLAFSRQTCGLPFVVPSAQTAAMPAQKWIGTFNRVLQDLPAATRETLHLTGFASVTLNDYRSIMALESEAVEAGYPQLK